MRASIGWGLFFCASIALGCRSVSERTLTDTESRTFSAQCERSGACAFTQTSGAKRADGKTNQILQTNGRLIGICDVEPGQISSAVWDCRPLVCHTDADCPPAHGMKDGQCLNSLCADAAQSLGAQDSAMLCLAGTGLGREEPRQVERYALGLNCGTPCKVPTPCRQP
ncbi:MAG TPA: hypothetical protein VHV51_06255 [Polyangiaceae bacterium]|jgi:hypothetical protein|nr:hypothetical protein [Polyangiaceae bacterium]